MSLSWFYLLESFLEPRWKFLNSSIYLLPFRKVLLKLKFLTFARSPCKKKKNLIIFNLHL